MTRVGVNLAWLVPGVVGGSEESTLAALDAVSAADSGAAAAGIELAVIGTPALFDAHSWLVDRFEHRVVGAGANRVRRVAVEATEVPRVAAALRLDLIHHAGGVLPLRSPSPSVVAIHDIQPLDLPDNFSVLKRVYLGRMLPRSIRLADALTVPSTFVRDRVADRLDADPGRITVVPWSLPASLDADPMPAGPIPAGTAAEVRTRLGLERPYVLYPAIPYRHKNHAVLLEAIARLTGPGAPDLVLTGGEGPCDPEIAERSARGDLRGRVHRLGRVPAAELRTLLAGAAVVAVPSRYEGFGLPALEALAAGRPCLVSSAGSLPEVTAGAALVIDPDDVDGWSDAIASVLDDPSVRARLESAGPAVAASWSPRRTADALLDVWSSVAAGARTSIARNLS